MAEGGILDKVKIIHASDLKTWMRFPEYRDHEGPTLGEYRARRRAAEAVLWQLRDLVRAQDRLAELDVNTAVEYAQHKISLPRSVRPGLCEIALPEPDHPASTLKDCFLIYDYASFPQDTTSPEDETALLEILSGMNALISNVLVLTAADFLERGWCIYEYIVASMRASIVCDELNDATFVAPRNLAATKPPVSLRILGHSVESEIQNAKNQRTLETVNTILPLFNRSKFSVERDREIVRNLLVSELVRTLPAKMEYLQYLGEWKRTPWTEEELWEAFSSELKWQSVQYNQNFKPFVPKVPSTLAEAVANGYRLDRMPAQNDWTWLTLLDLAPSDGCLRELSKVLLIFLLVAAGIVMLVLVLVFLPVRWIFF